MRLLQNVESDKLVHRTLYRITRRGEKEYHVGYFADYLPTSSIDGVSTLQFVQSPGETIVMFRNVERFPFKTARKIYTVSTEYFDMGCIFHRYVSFGEQKRAYASAYEKWAVNQIVALIVGHPGNYY
jgi:hypothetical protein